MTQLLELSHNLNKGQEEVRDFGNISLNCNLNLK